MAKLRLGGKRGGGTYKTLNDISEHMELIAGSERLWGDNINLQKGYVATGLSFDLNQKLRELEDGTDVSKVDLGKTRDWGSGKMMDFNKVTQNMDELTSKTIIGNENRMLIRNVGTSWAENALGITDLNQLTQLNFKGTKVTEKAFMSTSTISNKNVFQGRPIQLQLEAPKGTRGFVARNSSESEIVLPRNTQFRISSITQDSRGTYIVKARIINTPNNSRGFAGDPLD